MASRPRIALIHATRAAMHPVESAAAWLWPESETISILDEGLSVDRSKTAELSPDLFRRIIDLCRYAEGTHADGVLFTCSAFGEAIEHAGSEASIPVMKPNEAMFGTALSFGRKIAMIYTFSPAAAGMEEEFYAAAMASKGNAKLTSVFCAGALDAMKAGDDAAHDNLIAKTAAGIKDADIIMLAQFSMASAVNEVRKRTKIPVLTSPESAIQEIRRRIEHERKG